MTQVYGINISITVKGDTESECLQNALYYKELFRVKLHNQLKSKKMFKDLLKYEVELPNLQEES